MKKVILYLLLLLPAFAFAQTSLTSLSTTRYLTHSTPTIKTLTIYGKNLWPSWMTNAMSIELVQVYFVKGSQSSTIAKTSGNNSSLTVRFNSADWLTTPGKIEVYLTVGNQDLTTSTRTNSLWIEVDAMPTNPPVITDVSPKEFVTGLKKEQYVTTILGNFFGEEKSTTVTIGGIPANYARMEVDNGKLIYWIPTSLTSTPGTYEVVVSTLRGKSNAVPITIAAPSTKITTIKTGTTIPKVQVGGINKPITTPVVKFDPSVSLIAGARVVITGVISSDLLRTTLANHFSTIENVVIVKDETTIGENNANLLIVVNGERLTKDKLDAIKLNIENKLRTLGITPNVMVK